MIASLFCKNYLYLYICATSFNKGLEQTTKFHVPKSKLCIVFERKEDRHHVIWSFSFIVFPLTPSCATILILFCTGAVCPTMGNSNKSLCSRGIFCHISHCVDRAKRDLRSSYYWHCWKVLVETQFKCLVTFAINDASLPEQLSSHTPTKNWSS